MISILVMDVDGTLTDGKIYLSNNGVELKAFNVKDGYSIKHILPELGIIPMILTGRRSNLVKQRAEELGIKHIYQGVDDKVKFCNTLFQDMGVDYSQVAFVGDDFNDIKIIEKCGFGACPLDAIDEVKELVDVVLPRKGGDGAVYELIKFIKQNLY